MPSGEHKTPCASFHWPLWARQTEDRTSFFPPVCLQPLLLPTSPSQDNQTTLSFLFFISILKHRDIHWSFSDSSCKSVWIWMNVKMSFVGVCILTVYLHFIYYTTYFLLLLPRLVLCHLCLVFPSSHLPFLFRDPWETSVYSCTGSILQNYLNTIDFIIYRAES